MTTATAPARSTHQAPPDRRVDAPRGLHLGWAVLLVLAVVLPAVGVLATALLGSALLLIPAAVVAGGVAVAMTFWV